MGALANNCKELIAGGAQYPFAYNRTMFLLSTEVAVGVEQELFSFSLCRFVSMEGDVWVAMAGLEWGSATIVTCLWCVCVFYAASNCQPHSASHVCTRSVWMCLISGMY